jgi:hypothetical protein
MAKKRGQPVECVSCGTHSSCTQSSCTCYEIVLCQDCWKEWIQKGMDIRFCNDFNKWTAVCRKCHQVGFHLEENESSTGEKAVLRCFAVVALDTMIGILFTNTKYDYVVTYLVIGQLAIVWCLMIFG